MLGQQLRSFGRRWLSRTPPKSACTIELNSTCKHEKTLATTTRLVGSSGGGVRARVPWLWRFSWMGIIEVDFNTPYYIKTVSK